MSPGSPPGASEPSLPLGTTPPGRDRGTGGESSPAPPPTAERWLAASLPAGLVGETILGDLHQEFDERVARKGALAARAWYWLVAAELVLRYRLRALRERIPYAFSDDESPRSQPMQDLLSDLKFGFRMLRKSPAISAAAVLTIAVGVGMTVHTFSIVHGSVLRGIQLPEGERLVQVRAANPDTGSRDMYMPFPDYRTLRERAESFEWIAAHYETSVNLAGEGGPPERHFGAVVSGAGLARLGVPPHLGRTFAEDEDRPGADPVMIVSWDLWQNRFGGDPAILGREVRANGEPTRIVGVMPEGFHFPFDQDVWLPDRRSAATRSDHDQDWVVPFGLLKPDVGIEGASAEVEALFESMQRTHGAGHRPFTGYAIAYEDVNMPPRVTLPIKLQLLAVLGVLLIACANVANLLLARSTARSREVAVRSALGASRGRIVRQLLVETLVVAGVGGLLGIGLARVGIGIFNAGIAEIQRPYWIDVRLDPPAIAVAIGAVLVATLASGLLPALRATGKRGASALKDDARGGGLRLGRLSSGLVIAEVAVSAALLVMAGLMIKSIINVNSVELGFRTDDVLTSRVGLGEADYPDAASRDGFFRELLDRLEDSPGVREAALVSPQGPGLGSMRLVTTVEGEAYESDSELPLFHAKIVSEGYFETLDVPLLAGRAFERADHLDESEPVVIVSESLARRAFPDGALGRQLRLGYLDSTNSWMRIVGVVPDLYVGGGTGGIGDDRIDRATMYLPMGRFSRRFYTVLARGEGEPESLVPSVRAAVADLDPDLPVYEVASLEQALEKATWAFDVFGGLFSSLGFVALFLASVGLYGVMAFTVARRTRELGIRMAMGAKAANVVWLVVKRGARQLVIGLVVGLGIGALISRPLAAVTYDVSPGDPVVYLAIFLLLSVTGMLATLVPARRATRVDPSEALRAE